MGEVYEVEDLALNDRVALKTIRGDIATDTRMLARFRHEIQYAKRVTHPNICRIHDLGSHREGESEILFLTMELLCGETLADLLHSHGRLLKTEALPLVIQIAEALSAAHQAGVVHRDLKPSNIVLIGSGTARRAVVTDFGLAIATFRVESGCDTEPGKLVGTPAYMAPEQLTNSEITPATDVYALGLVMYEMITGQRPFRGDPPIAAAFKRLAERPPSPGADVPGLDKRWESTILRCLEREPARRFQDARDVVTALTTIPGEPATATMSQPAVQTDSIPFLRRFFRRRAFLVAVLLGVVLGLAGLFIRTKPPSPVALSTRSIAVLPFDNIGGDPQTEYYSDGFTEELINSLAKVPELRVIARESSFGLKKMKLTPQEIGTRLRVGLLVTGSIRRASGRLRIIARVVNTSDGVQVWSDSYEQDEQSLFQIEDRLAASIASAADVKLTMIQIGSNRGPIPNLEAQDLYWMGRYHWRSRTEDGLRRAIEYFNRAIEKDPGYAAAFSGLADVYSVLAEWNTIPPAEALLRARSAAAKAISLDRNLADAQVSMAHVTSLYDRDFTSAEKHFREALRLSPNLATAHQWYSYMLLKQRRFEESLEHARRALEIDPVSVPANQNLAALFHYVGQDDNMIRQYRKVIELEPRHTFAHLMIAEVLAERGLPSEAFRELESNIGSKDDPLTLRTVGEIGAILGNREQAEDALRRLIALKPSGGVSSCYIAAIYARLGKKDEAFQWLERAYAEWDAFLSLIRVYPAFASLRSDPRYVSLVDRLGLKDRTARG